MIANPGDLARSLRSKLLNFALLLRKIWHEDGIIALGE